MKYIKISSNKRSNGSPYNFNLNFTNPIEHGTYKLKNIVIPNTFPTINENNCNIYFSEDNSNTVLTATINPLGFYDSSNISTVIVAAMNTASLVGGAGKIYSVSLNTISNKFTFGTNSGNFAFKMSSNIINSAANIIGIYSNTPFLSIHTGESPADLTDKVLSFNIQLNGYGINNLLIEPVSGFFYSFTIPITVNSNEIQSTEFIQDHYVVFENNTRSLNVKILDDFGDSIYLQNDWYMLIEKVC